MGSTGRGWHGIGTIRMADNGSGVSYPKRDSHFAHRFVRLLLKMCIAQQIGVDAVMLLTAIAHTEDAKRYRAPVT